MKFARAADENELVKNALESVVLYKVNGKKDEGVDLARDYSIKGYPTFIVVNAKGDVIRRWIGYAGPEDWTAELNTAVSDPVSIGERRARLESDAVALALDHEAQMELDHSLSLYRAARAVSAAPDSAYGMEIFVTSAWAMKEGFVELDAVKAAADDVLAGPDATAVNLMQVGLYMNKVASSAGAPEVAAPYVEAAVKAAEEAELDDAGRAKLAKLNISHALLVDKDPKRAVDLKRASMPAGWESDADELNSFAWWCFEQRLNLEEAEALATKAVDLTADESSKANILDTLAEVRYAAGDRRGALEAIRQSIELDPDNEYFQKQLVKFTGGAM